MTTKLTVQAVTCAVILISSGVHGQDVLGDLLRERVDEHRLRHDYRVMQRDLAHGNMAAVQFDMQRVQQDQANLARDQAQLNFDLNGGGGMGPMAPYPSYPGYNPAGPGPGYAYPLPSQPLLPAVPQPMLQPVPQPLSQMIIPPLNPRPGTAGIVPPNPVPGVPQTIGISNPASTGVTLSYVFGGRTYSLDSGRIQEFSVMAPTTIAFNRSGQSGVARYTLTGGSIFEFQSDNSGWYMVQKRIETALLPEPVPPSPALNPAPIPNHAVTSLPPLSSVIPSP